MSDILVIFDDTNIKSDIICDVIGNKGFADVIVKKKRLEQYYYDEISKLFSNADWHVMHSAYEFNELAVDLETRCKHTTKILHCFSNYIISDSKKVLLSYEKLKFVDKCYKAMFGEKIAALLFPNIKEYIKYLKLIRNDISSREAAQDVSESFQIDGLIDIGSIENFIQCITGNFDSRFFNHLKSDEYTITKSSDNILKIKSEYTYYHLLPDDMKIWYVMPFNYKENKKTASYTMERLHMTDLSIKWVHGSVDEDEFSMLMDRYFYFFKCRHQKNVSEDEFWRISNELYINKVQKRLNDLENTPEYYKVSKYVEIGCHEKSINNIFEHYLKLKNMIEKKRKYKYISVIGHGDPCFANALYNKSTRTLKFIDPKGALTESDLWTNPYYDVAKLSHSVCGRYDFFNNALFDIHINNNFECELNVDFDNEKYIQIFKEKLEENGYDYLSVRIYEASLFLSMLPLHIDYPLKVLAFILNVKNILKEIELYV